MGIHTGTVTSIHRRHLGEAEYEALREALTLTDQRSVAAAQALNRDKVIRTFCALEEDEEYLHVPRGFPLPERLKRERWDVVKYPAPRRMRESCRFEATLSEEKNQPAAVAATLQALDLHGDAMLCLSPGRGKTVCALAIACERRLATVIVADRDFLLDQWEERIRRFVPGAGKIGKVKGKKLEIGDNFTLVSLKTLLRDPSAICPEQFGLVVFDECHVMAAPTFHRVISAFPHSRLGLTATPDRADGLQNLFKWHLGGEPCFRDTTNNAAATWYFRRLPELISEKTAKAAGLFRKIPGRFDRNGQQMFMLDRSKFDSLVSESPRWTSIIAADLEKLHKTDRQVIVLGTRVAQLEAIKVALAERGIRAGLVVGETKGRDRKEQFEHQIILATASLASKALDIDCLDCLVLLFPTRDEVFLRQAKGRTDRTEHRSLILTYSHAYLPKMKKLEEQMMELIRQVDSAPNIKLV